MKYIKTFEHITESDNTKIVYHRSDSLKHMLKADFKMEFAVDHSIFGKAIYFSDSPKITYGGMYCCKFKIILDEPILDMNKEISIDEANRLISVFNNRYKTNIKYKFKSNETTYGYFFTKFHVEGCSQYYKDFIQNYLGFNSFMYYQNNWTDFITKRTDYGRAYGIYDTKKIEYIETNEIY